MRRSLAVTVTLCAALWAGVARADETHVYTRGETLASIAERYYGDPALEPVVVAANYLYIQATPTLQTGMHLTIPTVRFQLVAQGDTWAGLARRLLGDERRGPYLARINRGDYNVSPSAGAVVRLPYLLRYVILSDEPLFEVARRFYGDRAMVQFILEFNHLPSQRLTRGQVLVLPLSDLVLREQPEGSPDAPLLAAHSAQRDVDHDLPSLRQLVARGLYVEAVALGGRLMGYEAATPTQRAQVLRSLAEAYAALDRRDLATDAYRQLLTLEPGFTLDPVTASPKLLDALAAAQGSAPTQILRSAPPTARPDSAH